MPHWKVVVSVAGERSKPMLVTSKTAAGAIRKALAEAEASRGEAIETAALSFCPAPEGLVVWETGEGDPNED